MLRTIHLDGGWGGIIKGGRLWGQRGLPIGLDSVKRESYAGRRVGVEGEPRVGSEVALGNH